MGFSKKGLTSNGYRLVLPSAGALALLFALTAGPIRAQAVTRVTVMTEDNGQPGSLHAALTSPAAMTNNAPELPTPRSRTFSIAENTAANTNVGRPGERIGDGAYLPARE